MDKTNLKKAGYPCDEKGCLTSKRIVCNKCPDYIEWENAQKRNKIWNDEINDGKWIKVVSGYRCPKCRNISAAEYNKCPFCDMKLSISEYTEKMNK